MIQPIKKRSQFDGFFISQEVDSFLDELRKIGEEPGAFKHYRIAIDSDRRQLEEGRVLLKTWAEADKVGDFVAIVDRRGTAGKHRTIMLKDIRVFGVKFVLEHHIWVHYTKLWQRVEPFVQGQKVLVHGRVIPYEREDGSVDYTILPEKVIKL